MPVTVSLLIPDPPPAPDGYVLVAFEVRAASGRAAPWSNERVLYPVGRSTPAMVAAGFLARCLAGHEVAAVAWFADRPLTECKPGRERLVSRLAVHAEGPPQAAWSEWAPEGVVGQRVRPVNPNRRRPRVGLSGNGTVRQNGTDLGDGVTS